MKRRRSHRIVKNGSPLNSVEQNSRTATTSHCLPLKGICDVCRFFHFELSECHFLLHPLLHFRKCRLKPEKVARVFMESNHLKVWLGHHLSTRQSIDLFMYVSIHASIHQYIYIYIHSILILYNIIIFILYIYTWIYADVMHMYIYIHHIDGNEGGALAPMFAFKRQDFTGPEGQKRHFGCSLSKVNCPVPDWVPRTRPGHVG